MLVIICCVLYGYVALSLDIRLLCIMLIKTYLFKVTVNQCPDINFRGH